MVDLALICDLWPESPLMDSCTWKRSPAAWTELIESQGPEKSAHQRKMVLSAYLHSCSVANIHVQSIRILIPMVKTLRTVNLLSCLTCKLSHLKISTEY